MLLLKRQTVIYPDKRKTEQQAGNLLLQAELEMCTHHAPEKSLHQAPMQREDAEAPRLGRTT